MTIETMKYANYENIGLEVIRMAEMDENQRPKTVKDLRELLGDNIVIPARYTKLTITQGTDDHLYINLPAQGELAQLKEQIKNESDDIRGYGIPDFYPLDPNPKATFQPNRFTFFRSRVAEYSIRGCR